MPQITFYRGNGSCAFCAHALLKELGIPFQPVIMNLLEEGYESADGSMSNEQYRQIHPSGYVPALKVDGVVITELSAILTYITTLTPESRLLGQTSLQRARVLEWLSFLSGSLHAHGFGMLFRPRRFTDDAAQEDAIIQKGREKVKEYYAQVEKRIGSGDYTVDDVETVVDFNVLIFYYWGLKQDFDMSPYTNYGRVVKRMESKKSVQAALFEEGLSPAF